MTLSRRSINWTDGCHSGPGRNYESCSCARGAMRSWLYGWTYKNLFMLWCLGGWLGCLLITSCFIFLSNGLFPIVMIWRNPYDSARTVSRCFTPSSSWENLCKAPQWRKMFNEWWHWLPVWTTLWWEHLMKQPTATFIRCCLRMVIACSATLRVI